MIDSTTKQTVRVWTNTGPEPYISVPLTQLDNVTEVLDANKIPYWVEEEVISIDDKPEIATINIEEGSNPKMIQHLLDSIP